MGKHVSIFILLSILISSLGVYGDIISMPGAFEMPQPIEEWFQNLNKLEKSKFTTNLQLYIHDVRNSANDATEKTVWDVAQAEITPISPTSFGRIQVVDNLVTEGLEFNSPPLGRVQGILAFSDLHETALYVSVNIAFTKGLYEGSTLSIAGRFPLLNEKTRELSIIGGTGVFRLACGIAVSITSNIDPATSNGVYGYSLYITNM